MDYLIIPGVFAAIIGSGALVLIAIDGYLRRREQTKSK